MNDQKIYRGEQHCATLAAVPDRKYSEPIPDEFLPRFEAAGLVVDDDDHTVILYHEGKRVAAVWGPAVEGDWFGQRGADLTVRVATRDDALRHVLDDVVAEVAS